MSDSKGIATFYKNEYSGSSSLLEMDDLHKKAYPQTVNMEAIEVSCDMLDNLFVAEDFKGKVILLKLDVQGAEDKVLKGAEKFLEAVDIILTEVSFVELYKDAILFNDMFHILEAHGFDVYGFENVSQSLNDGSFLQAQASSSCSRVASKASSLS